MSEHTWDTRAHIRQVIGNHAGAFADYEQAVNLGGERMVKLYQCGLSAQGLYKGRMDGYYTDEVEARSEHAPTRRPAIRSPPTRNAATRRRDRRGLGHGECLKDARPRPNSKEREARYFSAGVFQTL